MTWKPTNAQQLLLNAFLSIILASLAAAGTGFVTVAQSGNVNFLGCLSAALVAFWASFAPALYAYVPSHVAQELQALQDTQAQLQESHNAALMALNNAFSTIGLLRATAPAPATPAPHVAIYTQSVTTSAAPTQSSPDVSPYPLVQPTPNIAAFGTATVSNVLQGVVQPTSQRDSNATPADLLGDLPAASGVATQPGQITGVIPIYGQSAQ